MAIGLEVMLGASDSPEVGGIAGTRWPSFHLFPFLEHENLGKKVTPEIGRSKTVHLDAKLKLRIA